MTIPVILQLQNSITYAYSMLMRRISKRNPLAWNAYIGLHVYSDSLHFQRRTTEDTLGKILWLSNCRCKTCSVTLWLVTVSVTWISWFICILPMTDNPRRSDRTIQLLTAQWLSSDSVMYQQKSYRDMKYYLL